VDSVATAAFSEFEVGEVMAKHPGLRQTQAGLVNGTIELHHQYADIVRTDEFSIELLAREAGRPPLLRETGGRSEAIAAKHGCTDVRAVHRNFDGSACVCVKQEESTRFPPGSSLLSFVENLAIPYLFGLSYFDEFGCWPWDEYSHGVLGMLEFYADETHAIDEGDICDVLASYLEQYDSGAAKRQLSTFGAELACACGSGQLMDTCHREASLGMKRIVAYAKHHGLLP
jgi:hypothetical protein